MNLVGSGGDRFRRRLLVVDYLDDKGRDGFNERDFYAEWYPTVSLGKLTGKPVGGGPLVDVRFVAGFNAAGDAPKTDDSYAFDVSWLYLFSAGEQSFQITGHMEYIGGTTNEFGVKAGDAVFLQPQFRWDLGKALGGDADKLFAGIEYQYWSNKLGTEETESAVQLLLAWQL